MLKQLPQLQTMIMPNSTNPYEAVKYINSYIENHSCEKLSIDISTMNVLDACYVSTLCATKHFTKYPKGRVTWKISSSNVEDFNKDLELGNNSYIIGTCV